MAIGYICVCSGDAVSRVTESIDYRNGMWQDTTTDKVERATLTIDTQEYAQSISLASDRVPRQSYSGLPPALQLENVLPRTRHAFLPALSGYRIRPS